MNWDFTTAFSPEQAKKMIFIRDNRAEVADCSSIVINWSMKTRRALHAVLQISFEIDQVTGWIEFKTSSGHQVRYDLQADLFKFEADLQFEVLGAVMPRFLEIDLITNTAVVRSEKVNQSITA